VRPTQRRGSGGSGLLLRQACASAGALGGGAAALADLGRAACGLDCRSAWPLSGAQARPPEQGRLTHPCAQPNGLCMHLRQRHCATTAVRGITPCHAPFARLHEHGVIRVPTSGGIPWPPLESLRLSWKSATPTATASPMRARSRRTSAKFRFTCPWTCQNPRERGAPRNAQQSRATATNGPPNRAHGYLRTHLEMPRG
jgi:hypothetical protein